MQGDGERKGANVERARAGVLAVIRGIAPEASSEEIEASADLRQDLDLDSMDVLSFVIGLHARFGVDIPEVDYPRLWSFDGAVSYLAENAENIEKGHDLER